MATWAWFAIAIGTGLLVGLETWSWLRHGTSAVVLAAVGAFMLVQGLFVAGIVLTIGILILAGVTGWDPVGFDEGADGGAAVERGADCHPSYPDVCLAADAVDYDCDGGSGDGPEYISGPVSVTGEDPYGLDRDGDGPGCD
jgi:hypothetical protein